MKKRYIRDIVDDCQRDVMLKILNTNKQLKDSLEEQLIQANYIYSCEYVEDVLGKDYRAFIKFNDLGDSYYLTAYDYVDFIKQVNFKTFRQYATVEELEYLEKNKQYIDDLAKNNYGNIEFADYILKAIEKYMLETEAVSEEDIECLWFDEFGYSGYNDYYINEEDDSYVLYYDTTITMM